MADLSSYLDRYVQERGIEMPFYTHGSKVIEEAGELRDAIVSGRRDDVMEEAADVAMTALVAAHQFGFSLEEALEAKIAKDAGRGPKQPRPPLDQDRACEHEALHVHLHHVLMEDSGKRQAEIRMWCNDCEANILFPESVGIGVDLSGVMRSLDRTELRVAIEAAGDFIG